MTWLIWPAAYIAVLLLGLAMFAAAIHRADRRHPGPWQHKRPTTD